MKKKKKNFDDEKTMIFSETLTENPRKKKKKGKIVLLIFIILAILASGAYLAFFLLNNNEKNANTSDWTTYTKPKKVAKTLYIYSQELYGLSYECDETYSDNHVYFNELDEDSYFKKVGEYSCVSKDCLSYNGLYDYVIIYDNNQYYLYDYQSNKIKLLNISNDKKYYFLTLSGYDNVAYGIVLISEGSKKSAFYSFETDKITVDFKYEMIDADENMVNNIIFGYNYNTNDDLNARTIDVIDLTSGKVLHTFDNVSYLSALRNKTKLFYYVTTTDSYDNINNINNINNIYDDNFNLLFEGINQLNVSLKDNGNLIIINDEKTNFSEYTKSKKLVKTSKTYKSIESTSNDYAIAIDNDNYLVLLDNKENIITKFVETNDNLCVFGASVYNGVAEVTIEDSSISVGTMEYIKEYIYNIETGEMKITEKEYEGGREKPVLYLYPEKETKVTVTFEKPELLTTTYPKFINKWQVTASPNGDLYDEKVQYYYGLYWEESGSTKVDFSTGFYVTKESAINFLEEKLTYIGLNNRERNEFIMYWLPILEKNGKNLVYFELTEEREAYNKININPVPDSLLRISIHIKKVDKKVNIKEEKLTTFTRQGFTAVEWGGVNH